MNVFKFSSIVVVVSLVLSSIGVAPAFAQGSVTCFVDADATGANDGSSWTDAYVDLQSALGDSACGEIWVAAGVYKPGADRTDTFQLRNGVELYGGFNGMEILRSERDWEANASILSGDLSGNDNGFVFFDEPTRADNSYHVVTGSGTDASAVLDGFTLTGGNANGGGGWNHGGGLINNGSSPTLRNLVFTANSAARNGGGMSTSSGNPTLTDITFSNNAGLDGGGLYSDGGGVTPALTNITFSDNIAINGGGMYNLNSSPSLTNVTFDENIVNANGNLAGWDIGFIWVAWGGGAMFTNGGNVTITNATFNGNIASALSGGGLLVMSGEPQIRNSILWGNTAGTGAQVHGVGSWPLINDSIVEGGCPAGSTSCNNVINFDPLLMPLAENGGSTMTMALGVGSPAIDAGNNATCPETDQRGLARPQGAQCDIGAYEFEAPENLAPTADAGGPYVGFVGETITLDASVSFDPDGDALTYEWDLDNDSEFDDATGMTAATSFNQVGEYTIGLRVTDTFGLTSTDTATVDVGQHMPTPVFAVHPEEDAIAGWWGWPLGTQITFSVDDPISPNDPDYSGTTTVIELNPNDHSFVVYIGEFIDIKPGFEVTVSDGVSTKFTIVTDLEVTTANPVTDTISGTAEPGSTMFSQACELSGCKWDGTDITRTVMVDSSGNWVADYSVVGTWGEPVFDILPGANIWHTQYDEDGDSTRIQGWVPNPMISAYPPNSVLGGDWPVGIPVTLTIDNPNNGAGADYSDVITPGDSDPWIRFTLQEFDMLPGYLVTLSNGDTTKNLIVSGFTVTNVDMENNTVSGTGTPADLIQVWVDNSNPWAVRWVIVDPDGNWTVDFSTLSHPWDETAYTDLIRGSNGQAKDFEDENDGDVTMQTWRALQSVIWAHPNDSGDDWIDARDWNFGEPIQLTIDNDTDPSNGTLYTDSGVVGPANWNPSVGVKEFHLGNFDLEPGHIVTVTSPTTTKTLVITDLDVTDINLELDTISGTAVAGSAVQAWFHEEECNFETYTDENGVWTVDFTPCDIRPAVGGGIGQQDVDEDSTVYFWWVSNPNFSARVRDNEVHGYEWPLGATVTLTIDDPNTPQPVDYTDTQTVIPADWNSNQTFVQFRLWENRFNLGSGMTVTMSDGQITKSHIVTNLAVIAIDPVEDTVSGTAAPGTQVDVGHIYCDQNGCFGFRRETADSNGNWLADFSEPGEDGDEQDIVDITPGMGSEARQCDDDGDCTQYGWRVPNPSIGVRANDDRVEGWQWPLGATVNIEIDDPSTQANPDYSDSTTVGVADWDPNQTWFNIEFAGTYDIKVGDLVTVTDGTTTKQHTVVNLNFTQIETDTDRVFGTADSGQLVNIWTCWESDPCISRDETADQSGNWMTDFSVAGEQDWEQDTADLRVGSWIDSSVNDEDGDSTMYGVTVEASQCQPGDTITGTVFEHDGITPVPFAHIQIDDYNSGEIRFVTTTDSNGTFACSLPEGDYRIMASTDDFTYTQEYYNEATDINATPIHVTSGAQFTNVNFTITPTPSIEHFTFNLDNPLLQDLAVRQAIALGTDRQRILIEAFLPNGIYGLVANSIVVPEHWASAPASELELYPFDPAEARAILEASGWTDRDDDGIRENTEGVELAFTFKTPGSPFRMASTVIFQENMEAIGIRIHVKHQPLQGANGFLESRDFDIAEFAWAGCFDNEPCLGEYMSSSPFNYAHFANSAYDVAISNARSANSDVEKLPYLIEAQGILTNELPIFPLFTRYNVLPVATDPGTNISVSPETYLNITFDEVTNGGVTTVLPLNIDLGNLPPNFELLGQVYDIGTSASFTSAQVCFSYDDAGLTLTQENAIRLFHLENNAWVDVTDSAYPDVNNNVVCGTVTSFSPFAVMYPLAVPYAPFVVFGYEGVWIKENTDVISGDVAANISASGPYLTDQSEVTIGQHVRFLNPDSRVLADSLYLKQGSQTYDVYYNEIQGSGMVLGDHHTPLDLPLVSQFPEVPQVTPGTQNFYLPINGTLTLNAGSYGKLEAKKGSIITFTGGVYHFTEWTLGDNVKVYFTAPTEIRIAGKLDIGTDAYIGPASGSNLTAKDIVIYVLGVNGNNGNLGATPKAAKFGIRNTILANVYTPYGTLWIRENSNATGAFFGKWVMIGQNVTLTIDNGWR